ncbi:unnamed protein product [Cuscuta epithymum]|uniref:Uncharacterized protein n=1 Tax=Cuscuta epithymum TaxID=186058 RepID=A0AAV0C3L8_9ASTE|nr:unnamed protein product [Cuscuta epithymum]
MKGRGKRKFFKCLEPSGVHDGDCKSNGATDDAGKSKRSNSGDAFNVFPRDFSSSSHDGDFSKNTEAKSRRSISRLIKAILFETSLSRKFQKKGLCLPILESKDEHLMSEETERAKMSPEEKRLSGKQSEDILGGSRSSDNMWDCSSLSTTTASSSRASSRSASDRIGIFEPAGKHPTTLNEEAAAASMMKAANIPPILKPPKSTAEGKEQPHVPKHAAAAAMRYCCCPKSSSRGSVRVICFVIISLMALVFGGKVLAIVFTSIWLYLVPHPSFGQRSLQPHSAVDDGVVSKETTASRSVFVHTLN